MAADPVPRHHGTGRLRGRRALVVGGVSRGGRLGRTVAVALAKEGAAVAVADLGYPADRARPPAGAWPLTRDLDDLLGRARTAGGTPAPPYLATRTPAAARPEPASGPPLPRDPADGDAVRATARLLARLGADALPLHCDTGAETGCRSAVAHTTLEFGGIDVLAVCGRGTAAADGLTDLTAGDLDRAFRDTLYSALWLVQAARIFMEPGSSVVLTGAASGRSGSAEHIGLAAGAAAVMNLAHSLSAALDTRGIAVNCVVPEDGDDPHDVAAAYVRLARSGSDARTGTVLPVADLVRSG
ncbi:SDR family oxidoreductase [Marinactinospora rubrisoli]|uniref:SDR family oxidoreductase n=1 Tax=Marinactinospora rubrisoli TaxID=2715399 RepID=A0ABW2K967_9ACTN